MTKVLIAEDDLLIADMLDEVLTSDGYEVCGIARTVDEAVAIGRREQPRLAVLDLRLAAGGLGTAVARALDRQHTAVLYATGNAGQIVLTRDDGEACISKPYRSSDILRAVRLVDAMRGGQAAAAGPLPRGFSVLPFGSAAAATVSRPVRQASRLAAFGSFVLGEADLPAILLEGVRACVAGLDATAVELCRLRDDGALVLEAGAGWPPHAVGTTVRALGDGSAAARALASGDAVRCVDLGSDRHLPGWGSSLHVVVRGRDGQQFWGVLGVADRAGRPWSDHDADFLTGLANVLAQSVQTAHHDAAATAAVERLRDMVADRDQLLLSQQQLIAEREVLAQELQHRVRNNLQLVYSMLRIPAGSPEGNGADAMRAVARWVMTLSDVYGHLLGHDVTRLIDFGSTLDTLCGGFRDEVETGAPGVSLVVHTRTLPVDLDTATALGLVVAELVSNSVRHAFGQRPGRITVSMPAGDTAHEALIVVADDGAGYTSSQGRRRGLALVSRLMEQVGGRATVTGTGGTSWTLRFPVGDGVERAAAA